jgi:glutamate-1-semialdehyde 2,1-aminomutase
LALGELVLRQHRYVEMIRFVSSGTEAVMSAIRLARGASGKSKIVKFDGCYHGHVDSLMVKAGSGLATFGISTSAGIPESFARETLVVPLADLDALERVLDHQGQEIACVIIEPIPANNGLLLQDRAYLLAVRDLCTRHGVLLIFDEVISGFRVGFEGAAGLYAIQPDIITFGKILGGGMPVGAYAASRELMEHVAPMGPVYQAGTLSANPVAMAAGYATLQQLAQPGFYERLEATTAWFTGALESFCEEREYDLRFPHVGSIFWPVFGTSRVLRADQIDPARMQQFKVLHLECLKRGVYWGPSGYEVGFLSAAHDRSALEFALEQIKAAIVVSYDAELTIAH